jgi:hypothetical protein
LALRPSDFKISDADVVGAVTVEAGPAAFVFRHSNRHSRSNNMAATINGIAIIYNNRNNNKKINLNNTDTGRNIINSDNRNSFNNGTRRNIIHVIAIIPRDNIKKSNTERNIIHSDIIDGVHNNKNSRNIEEKSKRENKNG